MRLQSRARLTFSKGSESGMAWSPDSQLLAFSAKREGDDANQIYVLNVADGGEALRVTSLLPAHARRNGGLTGRRCFSRAQFFLALPTKKPIRRLRPNARR